MSRARRRRAAAAGVACLAAAGALFASDAYLRAKAALASVLIHRAWERHLADGDAHPPWSWADMHPVAVLVAGDRRRIVLEGAGGESLAFGIGHVPGTAAPNAPGNCVLAGHRDSAMAWLAEVRPGDRLRLETRGDAVDYRVERVRVVDRRDVGVLDPGGETRLTLVTCWPPRALFPGDARLVVVAESGAGSR